MRPRMPSAASLRVLGCSRRAIAQRARGARSQPVPVGDYLARLATSGSLMSAVLRVSFISSAEMVPVYSNTTSMSHELQDFGERHRVAIHLAVLDHRLPEVGFGLPRELRSVHDELVRVLLLAEQCLDGGGPLVRDVAGRLGTGADQQRDGENGERKESAGS